MDSFFKSEEVEYFNSVRKHPYRKGNEEDKRIDKILKDGVWNKTSSWLEDVKSKLEGYDGHISNQRTLPPGRKAVSNFKPYTWATIYKKGDADKYVYFTIGIDAGRQSILIKIHYQIQKPRGENSPSLTAQQRQLCEKLLMLNENHEPPYRYFVEFRGEEIDSLPKEQLVQQTIQFIQKFESDYCLIVNLIWPKLVEKSEPVDVQLPIAAPYVHSQRSIQAELIHYRISLLLQEHLISKYGRNNVKREYVTPTKTIIDMVKYENEKCTYYEIKTYPNVRECIREAIGQLIEYSHWPGAQAAQELIIVTPHPANQQVITYMKSLEEILNVKIYYQQFDLLNNILI